jgi:hypothetical protein
MVLLDQHPRLTIVSLASDLPPSYIRQVRRVISTIWNLILYGHLGTDKGANAALLAEVQKDGRLSVDKTYDVYGTLPNTYPTPGAFVDINPWEHAEISFSTFGFSLARIIQFDVICLSTFEEISHG